MSAFGPCGAKGRVQSLAPCAGPSGCWSVLRFASSALFSTGRHAYIASDLFCGEVWPKRSFALGPVVAGAVVRVPKVDTAVVEVAEVTIKVAEATKGVTDTVVVEGAAAARVAAGVR